MRFVKKNLAQIILIGFLVFVPVFSFAQVGLNPPADDCKQGTICNPIKVNSVNDFVKILLEGVIKVGIPIVALAIIYSGFLFVSARGNSEKLTQAKKSLLYTLIGAAILLGSWAIAQLIADTVLVL